MRKVLLICPLLFVPLEVFSVTYLHLNGVSQYTVTTLPQDVRMTCDLASAGSAVEVEIYVDTNLSGAIDSDDYLIEYLIVSDGIGWIRDPENPIEDIVGDETGVDGIIQTTTTYEEEDVVFSDGQLIIRVTDEDASAATASLYFDILVQPPSSPERSRMP